MTKPTDIPMQTILLSALTLAPENMRSQPTTEQEDRELEASIRTHGLIENLVVRPPIDDEDKATFFVVAGGRRLKALQAVHAEDAGETWVNCLLVQPEDAQAITLAENLARSQMHLADAMQVMKRLHLEGQSYGSLAVAFGQTDLNVQRLIKLADLHPDILQAFRNDEYDLDILRAISFVEDPEEQLQVIEHVKESSWQELSASMIRSYLRDRYEMTNLSNRMALVGREAYAAAGGQLQVDLFSEDANTSAIMDPDILDTLAQDKLQRLFELKHEGYGWFLPCFDGLVWRVKDDLEYLPRLVPNPTYTEKGQEAIDRLQAQRDALIAKPHSEIDDYIAYHREREELSKKIEGRRHTAVMRMLTDEVKAKLGLIFIVREDGEVDVEGPYAKAEDVRDILDLLGVEPPAKKASAAAKTSTAPKPDTSISAKHAQTLEWFRGRIMRQHLATSFKTAFKLLTFTLGRQANEEGRFMAGTQAPQTSPLDISLANNHHPDTKDRDQEDIHADVFPGEDFEAIGAALPMEWADLPEGESWLAFVELKDSEHNRIFAWSVAKALKHQLSPQVNPNALFSIESMAESLHIPWERTQLPQSLWFDRLTKNAILEIADATLDGESAERMSKLKKADLAREMHRIFSGEAAEDDTLSAEEIARAVAHVPEGFLPRA